MYKINVVNKINVVMQINVVNKIYLQNKDGLRLCQYVLLSVYDSLNLTSKFFIFRISFKLMPSLGVSYYAFIVSLLP